jgi:hypothetical protein
MNAGPPFDENNPEPRDCPKCGKQFLNRASRFESDGEGNPEPVFPFLCLTHGFFTFRESKGLTAGF